MSSLIKIKIIGAGPTGCLLAISLARIGCDVTLYDFKSKESLILRNRAYAFTHSTRRILQEIDLWDNINDDINSFNLLHFIDSKINKRIIFNQYDLTKENRSYKSIGWIIQHSTLMHKLLEQIEYSTNINLFLNQKTDSSKQDFDFIIAADGVNSISRKLYKINDFKFKYKQSCLTAQILIRNSDTKVALEILRPEGPFAVLPIRGDLFQIVWSASDSECRQRISLSKQKLLDQIACIMPSGYEPDSIVGEVQVFSNSFFIAQKFFQKRLILVGESAHSFHPIGGQGLNLCIRDVHVLTKLIAYSKKNLKHNKYLPIRYYLKRLPDVITVGLTTDIMIRLFSNNLNILVPIRIVILSLLSYSKLIRKFLLRLMTNGIYRKL